MTVVDIEHCYRNFDIRNRFFIKAVRKLQYDTVLFVGGAVVTSDYASEIGARYAKDARASVEIAREVFGT